METKTAAQIRYEKRLKAYNATMKLAAMEQKLVADLQEAKRNGESNTPWMGHDAATCDCPACEYRRSFVPLK